jgi:hypothetical protein
MKLLYLIVALLTITQSSAQGDTSKIYNAKHLKKGFYRSYDDYINNSPYIEADMLVKPRQFRKNDSSIIAVEYYFKNSKTQVPDIWGFCDGTSVYIHYPRNDLNLFSYKLAYLGPHPYFTFVEPKHFIVIPGVIGIIGVVATALEPAPYFLFFLNAKKEVEGFGQRSLKKTISSEPDLLKEYNQAKDSLTTEKIKDLLLRFNDRKK